MFIFTLIKLYHLFSMVVSSLLGNENDLEAIAEGEVKVPSCMDYVMHFLTVFWKVLFAFVPPTGRFLYFNK